MSAPRTYRDAAVVLRTYKLGESDRIVVLLTRTHGKVRAVAKGVRKVGSRLGARLEATGHVVVQLHRGRGELQTVTQVESVELFADLRADFDRVARASAMLEVVEQVAREGEATPELYELTVKGLRAVEHRPSPLVTASFFLRLLEEDGVGLQVEGCIECGIADQLVSLDLEASGLCCAQHRRGLALSPAAVELLGAILGGRMSWALAQPVTAATWEVDHLAAAAIESHLERRIRSLHLEHH